MVFFYNFRTKLKNGDDVLLPQLHRKCCLHFWHISVFCHALKFLFWNRFHQRATSKVHNDHVFLALKSHSHLSCQLFHRSTSKPLTEPNTRQNQESYLNFEITFETRWHFLVIFFILAFFVKVETLLHLAFHCIARIYVGFIFYYRNSFSELVFSRSFWQPLVPALLQFENFSPKNPLYRVTALRFFRILVRQWFHNLQFSFLEQKKVVVTFTRIFKLN